jgi:hypothetical protein
MQYQYYSVEKNYRFWRGLWTWKPQETKQLIKSDVFNKKNKVNTNILEHQTLNLKIMSFAHQTSTTGNYTSKEDLGMNNLKTQNNPLKMM